MPCHAARVKFEMNKRQNIMKQGRVKFLCQNLAIKSKLINHHFDKYTYFETCEK